MLVFLFLQVVTCDLMIMVVVRALYGADISECWVH
jgi:hypothetical protein